MTGITFFERTNFVKVTLFTESKYNILGFGLLCSVAQFLISLWQFSRSQVVVMYNWSVYSAQKVYSK